MSSFGNEAEADGKGQDVGDPCDSEVLDLRILVVLPNEISRWGLTSMLRSLTLVDVVSDCASTRDAAALMKEHPFDVVLLSADGLEDFEELALIAAQHGVKTAAVLRDASDSAISQAALLTTDGFLVESTLSPRSLDDALRRLHGGDMALPSSLARRLVTELRRRGQPRETSPRLTPREQQTLGLLAEGMSNKQIGRRLGISVHGAKRHVANLLAKLNCPNRTLAVAYAIRDGLLTQ